MHRRFRTVLGHTALRGQPLQAGIYDRPYVQRNLGRWLEYVGMSESEFDETAATFRDPRVWWKEGAEWKKDNIYACLNCHTPLQNQQEFIVKGLINGDYETPLKEPNPHFDRKLQEESITCATCHVRDGYVIGTAGSTNAPHKTIQDVEFLSEKLCVSCHNVVDELNLVIVCTFETGDEWINNWAGKSGKNCISCHMPQTERPVSTGTEIRKSHFHYFPGSGIPKFFTMDAKRLEALEIEEDELNKSYREGEKLSYTLRVKNTYAGHSVPTGDPERFFLISFKPPKRTWP